MPTRPSAIQTPERILVYVGGDRIGDGLMKLPFVRALHAAFPEAHVTWLAAHGTSVYAGPLAPLVDGMIHEVIEWAGVGDSAWELLRPKITGRFDLILDTQRSAFIALVLKRIPHRLFISGAAGFRLSNVKPPRGYKRPRHMLAQMLDLLGLATGETLAMPAGLDIVPPADAAAKAAALLPDGPTYVGVAPGARSPGKRWPVENFIAVARAQAAAGRVPAVFLGPMEETWRDEMAAALPGAVFPLQAAGGSEDERFDPMLVIALAARLAAALANDSGIGHLLAAGGRPLVTLYGPTPPDKFAPLTPAHTRLLASDWGGAEPARIPVEAVLEAMERVLGAGSA